MKKIFIIVVIITTAFTQKSFAQDTTSKAKLTQLLNFYYNIKDALVAGNSVTASASATEFIKTANSIDTVKSKDNIQHLIQDAGNISDAKDIRKQRQVFVNFSNNMFALVRQTKPTTDAIYRVYCPMKDAYWLSSSKTIKNPYFGSAMPGCGSIKETL